VNTRTAFLPLLLVVVACSTGGGSADPIAPAVAEAAATGKTVLVMYSSETCGCCQRMDEETFVDAEVKAGMENVIFVRVTKGKDAGAFESKWADAGTPSFVVLGADGEAKGMPLRGPFDAGEFLFLLDWMVDGEGPQPEIVRLADGCGGRGGCDEEEEEGEEGGCGGCGGEEGEGEESGCGGCSSE
jgi:Thioredoxin-like